MLGHCEKIKMDNYRMSLLLQCKHYEQIYCNLNLY